MRFLTPALLIAAFAFFCSIMPFLCAYNWTYGSTGVKLLNGLAAFGIVFVYVSVVVTMVSLAGGTIKVK